MVKIDNFGGLKSVLKYHICMSLTCEVLVRLRLTCEELYQILTNVGNWYLIFTCVSDIFFNVLLSPLFL